MPYECKWKPQGCLFKHTHLKRVMKHQETTHMVPKECPKCEKEFLRDRELNKHLLDEHNVHRKSRNTRRKWTCRYNDGTKVCGYEFTNVNGLRQHQISQGHKKSQDE